MTDTTLTPPAEVIPPAADPSPLGGDPTPAPEVKAEAAPAESLYPEDKAVETKTESEDAPLANDPPAEAAPSLTLDSYTITTPEGFVENPDAMKAFKEQMLSLNAPPEKAQELFNTYAAQSTEAAKAFTAAQQSAWDSTLSAWKAERAADPIIGGHNTAAVDAVISKALDEFGGETQAAQAATRAAFDLTGAGHNPAIIRLVYSLASALVEGTIVSGGNPAARQSRSPSERLYPNTTQ